MKKFQITYIDQKEIKPYKLNAKTHPQKQIELIKHSIDTFNFDQPIVIDENNEILKGHGRRLAAIELGIDKVPVIVRNDLTDQEKRACRLADNRSAESQIDVDILALELETLEYSLDDIGFDKEYLDIIGLNDEKIEIDDFFEDDESNGEKEKKEKTIICQYCGKENKI